VNIKTNRNALPRHQRLAIVFNERTRSLFDACRPLGGMRPVIFAEAFYPLHQGLAVLITAESDSARRIGLTDLVSKRSNFEKIERLTENWYERLQRSVDQCTGLNRHDKLLASGRQIEMFHGFITSLDSMVANLRIYRALGKLKQQKGIHNHELLVLQEVAARLARVVQKKAIAVDTLLDEFRRAAKIVKGKDQHLENFVDTSFDQPPGGLPVEEPGERKPVKPKKGPNNV
jgi:hypothetical protein